MASFLMETFLGTRLPTLKMAASAGFSAVRGLGRKPERRGAMLAATRAGTVASDGAAAASEVDAGVVAEAGVAVVGVVVVVVKRPEGSGGLRERRDGSGCPMKGRFDVCVGCCREKPVPADAVVLGCPKPKDIGADAGVVVEGVVAPKLKDPAGLAPNMPPAVAAGAAGCCMPKKDVLGWAAGCCWGCWPKEKPPPVESPVDGCCCPKAVVVEGVVVDAPKPKAPELGWAAAGCCWPKENPEGCCCPKALGCAGAAGAVDAPPKENGVAVAAAAGCCCAPKPKPTEAGAALVAPKAPPPKGVGGLGAPKGLAVAG